MPDDHTVGMAPEFTVSGAIAVFNQILEQAVPTVVVVGEVANFKVNQGKWVFFDVKDAKGSLSCFMTVYGLRVALEDGMKVRLVARPNVTKWGKFSLTVQDVKPVGAGSIKKSFELLKKKLGDEGLFDVARKRRLPELPLHIGVVSSVDAAGYKDFIKIINARMSGLTIDVISTQVQGEAAADQMITAIRQFNAMADPPEVLAILRGGGSRDDLVAFDDERLVRVIAASRIPTITGVGHEIDVTLADLVADKRASTPSNAAELLVPDKREIIAQSVEKLDAMVYQLERGWQRKVAVVDGNLDRLRNKMAQLQQATTNRALALERTLYALDPRQALRRGYAIVWNETQSDILRQRPASGDKLVIETAKYLIDTEVNDVRSKTE